MADEQAHAVQDASGEGLSTATVQHEKPASSKRKPRQLPRFKVLLHNDDVNHFEHVILSIMKLTPLSEQDALLRTIEAHESGVSLLLVTHQERAELYLDQFMSVKIMVTIEPE
jgi:ATP-dependent Clp protease adaptor protein ClpS